MSTVRIVVPLALADLWADRLLALCTVLALAAVLAPLIVLAGLREGVVAGLRELLLEDPHAREIVTAANRTFDRSLLDALTQRRDVAFLAPRTRTLSASLLLSPPDGTPNSRVELIPSGAGDPLISAVPAQAGDIVLSAAAAARLHAGAGDALVGKVGRIIDGQRQTLSLPLRVAAIAAPSAFAREGAFVTLDLAVLIEDFQDDLTDAMVDPFHNTAPPRRVFAGFRLYARSLDAVPGLDSELRAQGIDVVSRAGEVANLLAVDRSLRVLFLLVAGMGGSGFLVSLGAGLWANVERKRVSLALLQFLGLRRAGLSVFPLVQAAAMAGAGGTSALAGALLAQQVINKALAGTLAINRPLCVISPRLALTAVGITLAGALVVTAAAAIRAARLEPWEGVSTP
ncbi:MAG: hypothetical protein P4M00_24980 [Azospirillaceae bacterium]|nr:hypothetical protein [Azospirillaceae bacterium]